jgi:hypothetical protein
MRDSQVLNKKPMFDEALSAKLKIVSLVSIFLVLLNHVHPPDRGFEDVVVVMTRPNRVLFFGVAGFLFTFGFPFLKERLFQKWSDRAKTLLVPYLLTIIFGKVGVVAYIYVAPRVWLDKSKVLAAIWNDGHLQWASLRFSQEADHLWFLEGLILAVVLYGAVLVSTGWNQAVHVALVAASLAGFYVLPSSSYLQTFLFFGVGTLLARRSSLLTSAGPGLAWTAALGVAWVGCMWGSLTMAAASKASVAGASLFLAHSGIGAVFLWLAIDRIPDALRKVLGPFCPYVFPIYLIHIGVLALSRRGIGSLFWGSWVGDLAGLMVVTLLTAYGSFLLARIIETAFPSFASLWFGGRGAARQGAAAP